MQKTTLKKIADNEKFKLSEKGVDYTMQTKEKKLAVYTSCNSGKTFKKPLTTKAYVTKH